MIDPQRFKAAVKASGKTQVQIALEAGIDKATVNRLSQGVSTNSSSDTIVRLARVLQTQVGYLYGETPQLSKEDEAELLQFRGWIDDKLATIDAREEPNAILLSPARLVGQREKERVADRARQEIPAPFKRPGTQLVLRATGDSMIGAGILANDTLYTTTASLSEATGKIIACRLAGSIFVKRLVTEHRRLFLLSANPRYARIRIDEKNDAFEILGIVIGRLGSIE